MSALTLDLSAPARGVVINVLSRADCVWTREEFFGICGHMLNGNPATEFLLVYRDKDDRPKFAKSKKARADRRASWAWDTILGRAKSKVGIGFYPSNPDGKTRWGALDFDAHDGNALRARGLAMAAFDVLHRQPQLSVVLGMSGSEGWHLFAFTRDYHAIGEWTLFLKRVAAHIGAEVRPGICEVFPNDAKAGSLPYGIRAPGTWNPKTDTLGLIAYSGGGFWQGKPGVLTSRASPCEAEGKKERKESPFLYHTTHSVKAAQLHDRSEPALYRGTGDEWKAQFAITQPSTRRTQLKALVHYIFRQVGRDVARRNAEAQHKEANPCPKATLAEHIEEFGELWTWTGNRWHAEISDGERERFDALGTETDRDTFRIIRGFARKAEIDRKPDFPFPVEHVAARLGVTFQTVCKIRVRFTERGIIAKTASCIPNRCAARFRWLLAMSADEPF